MDIFIDTCVFVCLYCTHKHTLNIWILFFLNVLVISPGFGFPWKDSHYSVYRRCWGKRGDNGLRMFLITNIFSYQCLKEAKGYQCTT